ncbi:MAG: glycoside hydrolase family 88 protein [Thermoflexales bacterium]
MDLQMIAAALMRLRYKVWGFGESIAMEALLRSSGAPAGFAAELIRKWAHEHPALTTNPLSHVAPGVPLLMELDRTGDPALLRRAVELGELHANFKTGRHGARIHRPDLAGWVNEVWVDSMHLTGPFLARLGTTTGNLRWSDLAADLLLSHARVLQDDASGLFSHGFNDSTGLANRVFWGRGQGWAFLGLTDTLAWLPVDHRARREIGERLGALADALARTETSEGLWRTVLDHDETYIESSVGAFVALGVGEAVARGQIDARHRAMADRARAHLAAFFNADGEFTGTSDATPVGADAAHYHARPLGVFAWGQAPALLALLA